MPFITALPPAPSTSDPANFNSKADAHILALQTLTTEINAFGADLAGAGIITPTRDTVAATATTTDLWNSSKIQDWTGTPTITALPNAPQAGAQRVVYPAAGTIITHGGNISVQGNASYTIASGDELTITAITTSTFYVTIKRKDGLSVVGVFATQSDYNTGTDTNKALNSAILRANNLVLGTAITTTSGITHDFTSIPSWVKRITFTFNGVSSSGTSPYLIQIGDAGGIENTGYAGAVMDVSAAAYFSAGFTLQLSIAAAQTQQGTATLVRHSGNTWAISGGVSGTSSGYINTFYGVKTLSADLDRVRLTTTNGTDTFDAGSFNILYE